MLRRCQSCGDGRTLCDVATCRHGGELHRRLRQAPIRASRCSGGHTVRVSAGVRRTTRPLRQQMPSSRRYRGGRKTSASLPQQTAAPSTRNPHECLAPNEIAVNLPPGTSATPNLLSPQQTAVPSMRIPHEWSRPAETAVSLGTLAVLVVAAGVSGCWYWRSAACAAVWMRSVPATRCSVDQAASGRALPRCRR